LARPAKGIFRQKKQIQADFCAAIFNWKGIVINSKNCPEAKHSGFPGLKSKQQKSPANGKSNETSDYGRSAFFGR
jgi:hypothetical protein